MLCELSLAGVFKRQKKIVFGSLSVKGKDIYDKHYDMTMVIHQLYKLTRLLIYNGLVFEPIRTYIGFYRP